MPNEPKLEPQWLEPKWLEPKWPWKKACTDIAGLKNSDDFTDQSCRNTVWFVVGTSFFTFVVWAAHGRGNDLSFLCLET